MVLKQARFRPKTEQSFERRVKLHGSQTNDVCIRRQKELWRRVKLHGTQTYLVWQIRSAHFEEE